MPIFLQDGMRAARSGFVKTCPLERFDGSCPEMTGTLAIHHNPFLLGVFRDFILFDGKPGNSAIL